MGQLFRKDFLIIPPITTILSLEKDDLGINYEINVKEQRRLLHFVLPFCDGVLIGGTTGYGPSLTDAQLKKILQITLHIKKNYYSEKILLVGVIEASFEKAKERIWKILEIKGADTIDGFVIAPQSFFYRQSQKEIYTAMAEISKFAEKYKKDIFLYNISRSGALIEPETVKKLKNINNIRGIKDSSGNLDLFKKYLKLQDDNFFVFQGKPQFDLIAMENKGKGIIDANANFAPSLVREMVKCYFCGEKNKSVEIHSRILNSTNFLNQEDSELIENRLASRYCELYLLGVINILPYSLTEEELLRIASGLIKNEILKVEEIKNGLTPTIPFSKEDYLKKIKQLYELGYRKNERGRFTK